MSQVLFWVWGWKTKQDNFSRCIHHVPWSTSEFSCTCGAQSDCPCPHPGLTLWGFLIFVLWTRAAQKCEGVTPWEQPSAVGDCWEMLDEGSLCLSRQSWEAFSATFQWVPMEWTPGYQQRHLWTSFMNTYMDFLFFLTIASSSLLLLASHSRINYRLPSLVVAVLSGKSSPEGSCVVVQHCPIEVPWEPRRQLDNFL